MPLSDEDQKLYDEKIDGMRLLWSTGVAIVDDAVKGTVGLFESAFPGRISGYYVAGSYANGSQVSTSDLDLHPLFKGKVEGKERAKAREIGWLCELICPFELGVAPKDDGNLVGYNGMFKLATKCIYGEDKSESFRLPTIEQHIRMAFSVSVLQNLRGGWVTYPARFPDPDAEFFGYDRREVISMNGEVVANGLKDLVGLIYSIVIPLLARETNGYISSKQQAFKTYGDVVGGEWASLVDDVWSLCRQKWEYRVPSDATERRRLKEMCERVLEFENYYLREYRNFWVPKLTQEPLIQMAFNRICNFDFRGDEEVFAVLRPLREREDRIGERARKILAKLDK